MNILELTVLGLATWRISSLLAHEEGPWDLLEKIRHLVGVKYNQNSDRIGTNVVSKGVICIWCNSIWIGTIFILLHVVVGTDTTTLLATPFALSTLAIIIERYHESF